MSMSDALITDYSAAYYEYLMLNRPIGLIVEDLVEYNKLAGFYIPYLDIIKGEYMMNLRQLESFVQRIGQGLDIGYSARANSIERIHQYVDNHSTDRVIDWLLRRHLL
jgi:CDP-glycerol glycerophosphotransferase (TagB/SpsB family)